MRAGGEKLKKQKALTARLQKEIGEAEAEAARKAVQVKASSKSLEKLRKEGVKDGEMRGGPWEAPMSCIGTWKQGEDLGVVGSGEQQEPGEAAQGGRQGR